MKTLVVFLLVVLLGQLVYAQRQITPDAIRRFKEKHPKADVEKLLRFRKQQKRKWEKMHQEALLKAKKLGLPVEMHTPDGRSIRLQYFEHGQPVYYMSFNLNAARTISTDKVWEAPYNLSGLGIFIGQWDEGKIYSEHQEFFSPHINWRDDNTNVPISRHSTNVAGTMIAQGWELNAHGMAIDAQIDAYDWENDISEMAQQTLYSDISNHSYGRITGWTFIKNHPQYGNIWAWAGDVNIDSLEDYHFGFYTWKSKSIDSLVYLNPYYLPVISAGNDRDEYPGAPIEHLHLKDNQLHNDYHNPDGNNGYDCLPGGFQTAKNTLVIGAVEDIPNGYSNPSDVVMSEFSSWGPTDDGRIKPDVVANGVELITTGILNTSDYDTVSGTSLAAPSVTGSLALILEYLSQNYTNSFFGSTIKALVIHSADDAGNDGPDYIFGWGLMNTYKALGIIDQDLLDGDASHIKEITYTDPIDLNIQSDGVSGYIKVTACWSDPEHDTLEASLDPTTPMLVNDIDIELESEGHFIYRPYVLDVSNPQAPASHGINSVDNVEQIFVFSSETNFTLHITHKGFLRDGYQNLTLIVTGGKFVTSPPPPPPPQNYAVHVDQQLSTNASIGEVKFWDYDLNDWTSPVSVPYDTLIPQNDPYISVYASDEILSSEKFNHWYPDNLCFIWNTWKIGGDKNLRSQFMPVVSATLGKHFLISANQSAAGFLKFKDPWLINHEDSSYFYVNQNDPHDNKPKGFRNKGMNQASFDSLTLPANLGLTVPRRGVFLN